MWAVRYVFYVYRCIYIVNIIYVCYVYSFIHLLLDLRMTL